MISTYHRLQKAAQPAHNKKQTMANIQTDKTPMQRLLEMVRLERQDITLLVALTFGYGLLNIATPVAVQALVNIVTMGGVLQPLFVVSLILFALLVLSGMLYVYETIFGRVDTKAHFYSYRCTCRYEYTGHPNHHLRLRKSGGVDEPLF